MPISACQAQPLAASTSNVLRNVTYGPGSCFQQRHWWLRPALASSPQLGARQSTNWSLPAVAQDTLETGLIEVSQRPTQPRTRRRHQAAPATLPNLEDAPPSGTQDELSVLIDSSKLQWALGAEGTIELRPPDDPLVSSCSRAAQVLFNNSPQQPCNAPAGTVSAEEHSWGSRDVGQLRIRDQLVLEPPSTSYSTEPDKAQQRSKHPKQHSHGSSVHTALPSNAAVHTAVDRQQQRGMGSHITGMSLPGHPRSAMSSASAGVSHSKGASQPATLTRPRPASADATSAAQQPSAHTQLQDASSNSQGLSSPTHMFGSGMAQADAQHAMQSGSGRQRHRGTGHDPTRAARLQRLRRLLSYSPTQQLALTAPAWVWRRWRLRRRAKPWRRSCRMSVSRTSDVDVWGQYLQHQQQQRQQQQEQQQQEEQQRLGLMHVQDAQLQVQVSAQQQSQRHASSPASACRDGTSTPAWEQLAVPSGSSSTLGQQRQQQDDQQQRQHQQQHQHQEGQQRASAQQGATACGPLPKHTVAKLLIEVRRLKALQRQLAASVAASNAVPSSGSAHAGGLQAGRQQGLHRHKQRQEQQQQRWRQQTKPGLYAEYSIDAGCTWHHLPLSMEAGADGQQLIALGLPAQATIAVGSNLQPAVSDASATTGSKAGTRQHPSVRQQGPAANTAVPAVRVRLHGYVPCSTSTMQQQQEDEQGSHLMGCSWSTTLLVPRQPGRYVVQLSPKQQAQPPRRPLFNSSPQRSQPLQHRRHPSQQEQTQYANGISSLSRLGVASEAVRVLQQSAVLVADIAMLAGRKQHVAADDAACGQFSSLWDSSQAVQPSLLVYTTHRSWESFQQLWRERQHVLQPPDVVICAGGTHIMYRLADGSWQQDEAWLEQLRSHASRGWDRDCVVEAVHRAAARYNHSGALPGATQLQLGSRSKANGTGQVQQGQQGQQQQEPLVTVRADTRKEQNQHRVRLLVRAPQAAGFTAALQAELDSMCAGEQADARDSRLAGGLHLQQPRTCGISNGQHRVTESWMPAVSLPANHAIQLNGLCSTHSSNAVGSLFPATVCNGTAVATSPVAAVQPALVAASLVASSDLRSARGSAVAVAPRLAAVATAEGPHVLTPVSVAVAPAAVVAHAPTIPLPERLGEGSRPPLSSQHPASSNAATVSTSTPQRLQAQVTLQSPASLGCGPQWAAVDVVPPGVSTASALKHVLGQWGITPSSASLPLVYAATAPDPALTNLATHVIVGGRHGQQPSGHLQDPARDSGLGDGVAAVPAALQQSASVSEQHSQPGHKGKGAGSRQVAQEHRHGRSRVSQAEPQRSSAVTVQPGLPGAQAVLRGLGQLGLL